jgi:hypothetical protein
MGWKETGKEEKVPRTNCGSCLPACPQNKGTLLFVSGSALNHSVEAMRLQIVGQATRLPPQTHSITTR